MGKISTGRVAQNGDVAVIFEDEQGETRRVEMPPTSALWLAHALFLAHDSTAAAVPDARDALLLERIAEWCSTVCEKLGENDSSCPRTWAYHDGRSEAYGEVATELRAMARGERPLP